MQHRAGGPRGVAVPWLRAVSALDRGIVGNVLAGPAGAARRRRRGGPGGPGGRRVGAVLRSWRTGAGHPSVPDPFQALEVQGALGRLEREIHRLRAARPDGLFAQGHRLTVATQAYDLALDDACRLAGVTIEPEPEGTGQGLRRLRAELELRSRGWQW
jgi:hypothetical protein